MISDYDFLEAEIKKHMDNCATWYQDYMESNEIPNVDELFDKLAPYADRENICYSNGWHDALVFCLNHIQEKF